MSSNVILPFGKFFVCMNAWNDCFQILSFQLFPYVAVDKYLRSKRIDSKILNYISLRSAQQGYDGSSFLTIQPMDAKPLYLQYLRCLMQIECNARCFLAEFEMEDNHQSKDASDRSDLISDDGKNCKSIVCQRCRSKVLCPGMASLAEKEVNWQCRFSAIITMHLCSFHVF